MGYESLVEKIKNGEVLQETPIYGRVKSEDELKFEQLRDAYRTTQ